MSKLYIHRGSTEELLWEDVFSAPAEEDGICLAINGPNNIGKTSLVKEMIRRFNGEEHENVYCYFTSLSGASSINHFWLSLFRSMKSDLTESVLRNAPHANEEWVDIILAALEWFGEAKAETMDPGDFAFWYDPFFPTLRRIGIKIILIIDEFDLAQTLCTDGLFFGQLYDLSNKGKSINTHAVILVSRRHVSTIEHHMHKGSHLADAYAERVLHGFTNDELNEYFQSFSELPCGMPTPEMVQDIMYYCGRNPGLLMRMREYMRHDSRESVPEIFRKNRIGFTHSYNRMIELMQCEYVDRDSNTIRCFDVFLEDFIGPVTDENHNEHMQDLYSHGFVTEAVTSEEATPLLLGGETNEVFPMTNLFAIAGIEEDRGNKFYEPLSLYFVQYIKQVYLPGEKNSLAKLLDHAEIQCRLGILTYFTRLFGSEWEDTFENTIGVRFKELSHKRGYLNVLRRNIEDNNGKERGITGSIIDVLSFNEYYNIIIRARLNGFFRFIDDPAGVMFFLTDCRNLHAHKNMRILDDEHCRILRRNCEELVEGISKSLDELNTMSESDINRMKEDILNGDQADDGPKAPVTEKTDPGQDPTQYVQKVVSIDHTEVKAARKNLVGLIAGTNFKVSVPHVVFQSRGEAPSMYAGRTVQVKLLVWESNPANPHFVATLDTESDSLPQNNSPSTPDDPQSRLAQQYIQQVVIMENTEYRPLRGNISGTLRGTDFRISIPQREMTAKNIPYTALTGKDLEVRLISWDNNPAGPHFCAELI